MAKKSAVYNDYTINVEDNGSISVYQKRNGGGINELCSNSMAAMREISKQCGFTIDGNWNTRQTGSKLIDFLNSSVPHTEQSGSEIGAVKNNKVVLDLILTTEPDRPVYILGTHVLLDRKVNDIEELPAVYEELYNNAEHQNEVALLYQSTLETPKALFEVYNVETNECWGKSELKMPWSWAIRIDDDLDEEEQEDLQKVRQAISNSHLSENTPMEEAMVKILNSIKTKDDLVVLPSLLSTMLECEYKQYDDNTQYVLAVEKYSQVQIRYRIEVDAEQFSINPSFWLFNEYGWTLPSLGDFSLDNFTDKDYLLLNIMKNESSKVVFNCTEIKYNREDMEHGEYCLVNSKLEEIDVSRNLGVSNFASKLFSSATSKSEKKNEAIVRFKDTILQMIVFEDDDSGDEYQVFTHDLLWNEEFEVEADGKVSTYTLEDCVPEGVDIYDEYSDNEWEFFEDNEDDTAERCHYEEWAEVNSEDYYNETLEYTIPLKDGEAFDIKKLRFAKSGDHFHNNPADAWYIIYDGKRIEESSGVLESYFQ